MAWSALSGPSPLRLRDEQGGTVVSLMAGLTIGRNRRQADYVLNDRQVSGLHARVEQVAGALVLVDQHSANGTFVGEQRVERCLLRPGLRLRLGQTELVVEPVVFVGREHTGQQALPQS